MLSPAFPYLDPVHAFLSNKFSYNTVLIRFILGSENLQHFPITYWIEYICLARPYIIWLQPTFPGSSFTSLFFSQSSPFVLLKGGSLPSYFSQCCSQNCLLCPFFWIFAYYHENNGEHLGWFYILPVVNNASVNIGVHVFFKLIFFQIYTQE